MLIKSTTDSVKQLKSNGKPTEKYLSWEFERSTSRYGYIKVEILAVNFLRFESIFIQSRGHKADKRFSLKSYQIPCRVFYTNCEPGLKFVPFCIYYFFCFALVKYMPNGQTFRSCLFYWTRNAMPEFASLNFIRLLRVVITPSVTSESTGR